MIVPVRDFGKYGIVTDVPAYDLPIGAASGGNNVRFEDGRVVRAPVFRTVDASITPTLVIGATAFYNPSGIDTLFYVKSDGSIYSWVGGTETDRTIAAYATATNDYPVTFCTLAGLVYYNRYSHVPYKFDPVTGTDFALLTNWDVNHKCRVMRTFGDYLVALNILKTATEYPTMVKTSDVNVAYGSEPPSWDHTDPTTSATENTLSEADSAIVDGLALRNAFVIYTDNQAHLMTKNGGQFIFQYRKIFDDAGVVNANCIVEVEGKHYVFGRNDIYVHDTVTKTSIADDKVRKYIFAALSLSSSSKFFVYHDERRSEVVFNFVSGESDIKWPGTTYCNRAAAYNYKDGTWSFRDVPNASCAAVAKVNTVLAWSGVAEEWDAFGSTWASSADTGSRATILLSSLDAANSLSSSRILALDNATKNAILAFAIEDELVTSVHVAHTFIDMDDMTPVYSKRPPENIRNYKVFKSVFPQIEVYDDVVVDVSTGGAIVSGDGVAVYDEEMTFTPSTDYQVDFTNGGRYLHLRFDIDGSHDFALSGFDLDYSLAGKI